MELQEFAERILLGKSLSEKLLRVEHLQDHPPPSQKSLPPFPNRPSRLALDRWHQTKRTPFPNVRNLENEKQRGVVLHFFANHELLALELLALALLKFPQAPPPFRWGLLHTLLEEQTHLRIYEERMRHYQVEFGEIPVNDFFWKCLSAMETPLDFVAGMSLTLEQANLDYAKYYASVFRTLDDPVTADILERVYEDEIRHVGHGLQWLRHWKKKNHSDWQAHQAALQAPLTPARAKGLDFNKQGRRRAGFSENYISELRLFSQSKGRVPDVFFFNPTCESEIAQGQPGWTPPRLVAQLVQDLSALPMFLARQDDGVLLEKKPTPAFLTKVQQAGFALPEWIEIDRSAKPHPCQKKELLQRKFGKLRPWGWSPESAKLLEPLSARTPCGWDGRLREFFSKTWSAQQLGDLLAHAAFAPHWQCDPKVVGRVCKSLKAIETAQDSFGMAGFSHLVAKGAFGASGQNKVHLKGNKITGQKKKWLLKLLKQQGALVVEPWLEKQVDLSFQWEVQAKQTFSAVKITQFFTDARGQYRGSVVGRFDVGLENSLLRFLHPPLQEGHRQGLGGVAESIAEKITPLLAQSGYAGPVGVDALVYKDPQRTKNSLCLKPIVEINPRFSMGRLSLELARHLQHRHVGLWLILNLKEVQANGFENFVEFAHTLETQCPLQLTSAAQPKIGRGAFFTNDPHLAQGFLSVLLVGKTLEECWQPLEERFHATPLLKNRKEVHVGKY